MMYWWSSALWRLTHKISKSGDFANFPKGTFYYHMSWFKILGKMVDSTRNVSVKPHKYLKKYRNHHNIH